jgi:hypothetical protein
MYLVTFGAVITDAIKFVEQQSKEKLDASKEAGDDKDSHNHSCMFQHNQL